MDSKSRAIGTGAYSPAHLLPLVIFLAAVSTVLFVTGNITFNLNTAKNSAFYILLTVLAVVVLIRSLYNGKPIPAIPALLASYSSFVLLSMIPLFWSRGAYDPMVTIATWMATFALFLLLPAVFHDDRDTMVFFLFATGSVIALSAVGWMELTGILSPYGKIAGGRVVSTVGNPDFLGGVLVLLLPIVYGLFLHPSRKNSAWARSVSIIAILTGVSCLLLTRSKGAMVAAVVSAILFLFLSMKKNGRRLLVFVVGMVGIGMAIAVYLLMTRNAGFAFFLLQKLRIKNLDIPGLFSERLPIWQTAIQVWLSDPPWSVLFGTGPGGFYSRMFSLYPSDYRLYSLYRGATHAHSEYLHVLAEGGLLGFLAWIGYVAMPLVLNSKAYRKGSPSEKIIATSLLSALAGGLIHQAVSPVNRTSSAGVLFSVILGLSYLNARPLRPRVPLAIPSLTVPAFAFILLVFPQYTIFRRAMADHTLLQGIIAGSGRTEKSREISIQRFGESLWWQPDNVEALYQSLRAQLSFDPSEVRRLAARIEGLIPDFRRTVRYKGIAEAEAGDYATAAASFSRYLDKDAIEPSTTFHLASSLIMAGTPERSVAVLRSFFVYQHGLLMSHPEEHFDWTPAMMVFTDGPESSGPRMEYRIDLRALESEVRAMASEEAKAYTSILLRLYLLVGSVYDRIGYGSVGLDYFMMVAQSGVMPRVFMDSLYTVNARLAAEVKTRRTTAIGEGRGHDAMNYNMQLVRLLRNLTTLAPTPALRKELESLTWDSEDSDQ